MRIVKITADNIDSALHIERACFSSPWSEDNLKAELTKPDAYLILALDEESEKAMGYAGLDCILDEGYMLNLAVLPEFRRRSVARGLMEEILSVARDRRLKFVTLEVRQSNLPAVSLYTSLGFAEVGRRRGYYSAPKEDAILMTKYLEER